MTIKSIDTPYDGYLFRSRLEARWAVYFKHMDIDYSYEPVGVTLSDGSPYLPDFYFPELEVWAEVKATMLDAFDYERVKQLALDTGKPVLILDGDPTARHYSMLIPEEDGNYDVQITNIIQKADEKAFITGRFLKGDKPFKDFGDLGKRALDAIRKARSKRFGVYTNTDAELLA